MRSPTTVDELAEILARAASHDRSITLVGNGTKGSMAGPIWPADEVISTSGLNRVLQYEPRDLTISVEAGLPWRELTRLLGENRQMVPLDPPFGAKATVGGVVAANICGPRRRLYGSARDLVIGMKFATLQGKIVQSGGMVVKNVAGLDMSKLMVGSLGTLAAIAVVNFKVQPMPQVERSFVFAFDTLPAAMGVRDRILKSALQPAAIDLLNPHMGAMLGNRAWLLALRAGGNSAAVDRYERELAPMGNGRAFDGPRQEPLWHQVAEFTPKFLARHPDGTVVRASCTLKGLQAVMASFEVPAVARAGSGVCYGYFEQSGAAAAWIAEAVHHGWNVVIDFSPEERKQDLDLWPTPGSDLEIMRRVKHLFDPGNVLNRGRLYRRI